MNFSVDHKNLIKSSHSFDIPFSIRTIKTQLPVTNNVGENWTPIHNHQVCSKLVFNRIGLLVKS